MRFALDAITSFSYFPLQIMIYVSLVLGVLALLAIPVVALLRLSMGRPFLGGQATTIILLLLMSSFQLFFLFIWGSTLRAPMTKRAIVRSTSWRRTVGFDQPEAAPEQQLE